MFLCLALPVFAQPLAHWKFEDTPGSSQIADETGTYPGQMSAAGSSLVGGGVSGQALQLARALNGHVDMGNVLALSSGNFTLSCWVKMNAGDRTESVILHKHQPGSRNGYYIGINMTGGRLLNDKASLVIGQGAGAITTTETPISTTSVNDGNWHHIVTIHEAGGTKRIYVDGIPAEDSAPSQAFVGNTASFIIGGARLSPQASPTGYLDGMVDEVQIYERALTDSEINALFSNPGTSVGAPPSIITHPRSQIAALGDEITFSVDAASSTTPTYQWNLNGNALPGAIGSSLTLDHAALADAGSYAVVVANSSGSVTSLTATLAVKTNLVARWSFEDSPGSSTTADGAGNFPGQLSTMGASLVPGGVSGQALQLERSLDGHVEIGNVLPLSAGNFTISSWVKLTSGDRAEVVMVHKHQPGSRNGYYTAINTTGGTLVDDKASLVIGAGPGPITTAETPISSTPVNDGQWHHIVAVHEAGVSKRIYVDGIPAEDSAPTQGFIGNTASLILGGARLTPDADPTGYLQGMLDEVQIFARPLTDMEISFLYTHPHLTLGGNEAPAIVTQPSHRTIRAGADVSFQIISTGSGPLTYQWYRNGSTIAGATFPTLNLTTVGRSDLGNYSARVSNHVSHTDSTTAALQILFPQQFQAPQRLPDGSFRLTFGNPDNNPLTTGDFSSFELQRRDSLSPSTPWLIMNEGFTVTNGQITITDTDAAGTDFRIYRVLTR